ncbi:MAG: S8/S53 family peptidase [Actinobacteria bacterium]|nr:S8/S53 family peptidase [Actinomycetota bacterium]
MTPRRFLPVLSALLVCGCALLPAIASADTVAVGEAPPLPVGATIEGPVAPQRPLNLYVALEPRDPEALRAYAEGVGTPGSPLYGRHLSVAEFARRFGPTAGEIATVSDALEEEGLAVGTPTANLLALPVEATAAEAEAAFDTEIERIRTAEGEPGFISTSDPQVDASAAPYVSAVLGLDDLPRPHRAHARSQASPLTAGLSTGSGAATASGTTGPQPCSAAIATGAEHSPSGDLGYTGNDLAAAYDFDQFYEAGNFGAGQSIGLFEEEPFSAADIATFQQCYGTHAVVETVEASAGLDPKAPDEGEAALDIEQVIQLAPEARVVVYWGEGANNEVEILSKWVSENRAKVMSSSDGICEGLYEGGSAGMDTVGTLLQEAAVQGQTFVVASGDYGAADCSQQKSSDKLAEVDFPGSNPFATDVGGTRMEEPHASVPTEYLWNDAPRWGAGGGGISRRYPMPSYQQEATPGLGVINALSKNVTCGSPAYCREVPDVAADASVETGVVIYFAGQWEVNGGTSAAAPLWGALATLTNASPACGGHSIGFLNPALYSIAGTDYAANFRDIVAAKPGGYTTTDRDEPGTPYPAATGYDMASGLGVPIAGNLGASLCALANPVAAPEPPAPPATPALSGQGQSTAKPTPSAPVAHLASSHLAGIAKGAPILTLGIEARQGSRLETVTIALPSGLTAATAKKALAAGIVAKAGGKPLKVAVRTVGKSIQIRLLSPIQSVSLQIRTPAVTVTDKLRERAKTGKTKKLGLVVTTKESGGQNSRFPLTLPL